MGCVVRNFLLWKIGEKHGKGFKKLNNPLMISHCMGKSRGLQKPQLLLDELL